MTGQELKKRVQEVAAELSISHGTAKKLLTSDKKKEGAIITDIFIGLMANRFKGQEQNIQECEAEYALQDVIAAKYKGQNDVKISFPNNTYVVFSYDD